MGRPSRLNKYDSSFLATFKAKYLGMSLSRSGNDPSALRLAAAMTKRSSSQTRAAKVHMTMRLGSFTVTDRASADILFQTSTEETTWHGPDPDSKDHLLVVTRTEAGGLVPVRYYCHVMQLSKGGDSSEALRTLDAAFGGRDQPRGQFEVPDRALPLLPTVSHASRVQRHASAGLVFPEQQAGGRRVSSSSTGSLPGTTAPRQMSAGALAAMKAQQLRMAAASGGVGGRQGSMSVMRHVSVGAGEADVLKFAGVYLGCVQVKALYGLETVASAYSEILRVR